jgi:probable HAF family extracellular repeat protein
MKRERTRIGLHATILVSMLMGAVACAAKAQTTYTITDLGILGAPSDSINAAGLNNRGEVVGFDQNSDISYRAFLYNGGHIQNLGTLGGSIDSSAQAINNLGEVVGNSNNYAFVYQGKKLQVLGKLPSGSSAYGVNDSGEVTGISTFSGAGHAFLYSNGTIQDLGVLGGDYSFGTGVNSRGQVVGSSVFTPSPLVYHAFLYSAGRMQDVGSLGFLSSYQSNGHGINDHGQVVGTSYTIINNYNYHAFLYSGGTVIDLGALSPNEQSGASAINNLGAVVGSSYSSNTGSRAFLYSAGLMKDLNNLLPINSGWVLAFATGVNDEGQICGSGTHNGLDRAFLMTPVKGH